MEIPEILAVDDEEEIRILIEQTLTPLNYRVDQASNGEEAIEKIKRKSPDVILLDVHMPKKNGFEVLKFLKENIETEIIPVVILTAADELPLRRKAYELGVDGFFKKPFDIIELKGRVKSLLKLKTYTDYLKSNQEKLECTIANKVEELQHVFNESRNISYETIWILSRASEYRDEDTGDHILRVSNYSSRIAQRLKKNKDITETILYGSIMHDIGKIGIPDRILLKESKLDSKEMEIIKGHPEIGARILGGSVSQFVKTGREIALSHHEKWDGSGYPNGLIGKSIPLSGRIVAIADVFDALTSKRPYKKAFSVEKASTIIKEGKGKHFDPELVDIFLEVFSEILSIKYKYNN